MQAGDRVAREKLCRKGPQVPGGSELSPGSTKAKNLLVSMNRSTASRLMDVIIPHSSALIRL